MLRASIRLAKDVPRRSRVCSVLSIERAIELAVLAARAPWSSSARASISALPRSSSIALRCSHHAKLPAAPISSAPTSAPPTSTERLLSQAGSCAV